MKRFLTVAVVLCLGSAAWVISGAASASTAGTWTLTPPQSTVLSAQPQQPLAGANTSNWSSQSKGAIAVKFGLFQQPGPFVFQSIASDNPAGQPLFDQPGVSGTFFSQPDDFSALTFTPTTPFPLTQLSELRTNYLFSMGNCHGGALRWSVELAGGNIHVYYGDNPNFTDCISTPNNQSGQNLVTFTDSRYDTSQLPGGTFYDTLTGALSKYGAQNVLSASLVIDAGWVGCPDPAANGTFVPGPSCGDQQLTPSNVTVNGNTFVPASGPPTQTCNLSQTAYIHVTKLSGVPPTGTVTPASVQKADNNGIFRVADCKYMYNLAIPSLAGVGTYRVDIDIPNGTVIGSATFGIK